MTLLSLVGCGSKEKPVNLEVSSSFALGAAGFTGGLIAYGDGPNGKKFSVSAQTGKSVTANIVSGAWQIYIIGWEGAGVFQGTKQCGMLSANLGSTDTSVNVSISTAKCSDAAFQGSVEIQELYTTSCGAFYKYNSATDTYSDPTAAEDNYCTSLPTALGYSHQYQKIVVQNIQDQGPSQGISSECIATNGTIASLRRFLPTKKFPFIIKTYPNLSDCQNSTSPQVALFNFPNGIQAGNIDSFGHEFVSSGAQARLSLPSLMTRRGRSPFMDMLPRILCGASGAFTDCLPAPTFSGVPTPDMPIHVDINSSSNEQLLLKGVGSGANVSAVTWVGTLAPFVVSDLKIRDGNLVGNVSISVCGAPPCVTSVTVSLGSVTQNLYFKAITDTSIYRLFEKGFELVGMRFISDPKAFYYFRPLMPEGEELQTGGQLSRVSQMLGPDGVASFASEFANCTALKNEISSVGVSKTRTLYNMSENKFETYTVTFQIINEAIPYTFCVDNNPGTACAGTDKYDIRIDYHNANPNDTDRGRFKLACNRKVGRMEGYDNKSDSSNRDILIWNTGSFDKARFESYYLEEKTGAQAEVSAGIDKFYKMNASDFWSRSVHTREDSLGAINSSIAQYENTAGVAAARSFHLYDTSYANFIGGGQPNVDGYSFGALKNSLNFSMNSILPAAGTCRSTTNGDTQGAGTTCPGSLALVTETTSSAGIPIQINSMINISDTSTPHPIRTIFTLP